MIQLDENYRIETDVNNFTLKFEKEGEWNEKTKKFNITRNEWYFPSLEMALERYCEQCMKIPQEIQALQTEIQELKRIVYEAKKKHSRVNQDALQA